MTANHSVIGKLILAISCLLSLRPEPQAATVDFSRDIYPILSDRCFACHGPDAEARKADLRLDQEAFLNELSSDGDRLITPGNALPAC